MHPQPPSPPPLHPRSTSPLPSLLLRSFSLPPLPPLRRFCLICSADTLPFDRLDSTPAPDGLLTACFSSPVALSQPSSQPEPARRWKATVWTRQVSEGLLISRQKGQEEHAPFARSLHYQSVCLIDCVLGSTMRLRLCCCGWVDVFQWSSSVSITSHS